MAELEIGKLEVALAALELSTPLPKFASADVLNQPLDIVRTYLADILSSLLDCNPSVAFSSIQLSNDPLHGDFTVVLPKLLPGSKAGELAADLIKKFPTEHPLFGLPWLDGVQLRLCLKAETLPGLVLPFIADRKGSYGVYPSLDAGEISSESPRKKLVVEFSSPNIASDFQGKHLRSTILGAFISTIHERFGWDVTKRNYLGDWGKDIALLGVGWEKFCPEEAFDQNSVERLLEVSHKIHGLFLPEMIQSKTARDEAKKKGEDEQEVTAEIESKGLFAERNAFFKRMEESDEKAASFCKYFRDINIDNLTKFYERLGFTFDEYSGESKVTHETIAEVENLLKEKGLLEESGGALVIDMKKCGAKTGTAIIRDRTGGSTYLTRYLAAVLDRSRQSEFDKLIFVAADRTGHYLRLIKIFEALDMNELANKLQHVSFNDMSHMMDQVGHGHQPDTILDKCESATLETLKAEPNKTEVLGAAEHVAKPIAMTALLAQEVSAKRASDHAFDIPGMASFKSGTGLHLQYWYSRLEKFLSEHRNDAELPSDEFGELVEEEHTSFLLLLGQFPEVIHSAFRTLEPAGIVTYLNSVTEQVEDFLDEDEDDGGEDNADGVQVDTEEVEQVCESADGEAKDKKEVSPAEVALYETARQVLENGMKLLGFPIVVQKELDRADTPVEE